MGQQYHLTLAERIMIQSLIENGNTASEIGQNLKRDASTIRREVKLNRYLYKNETNRFMHTAPVKCIKLNRFPYTCIGCRKMMGGGCLSSEKAKYIGERAHTYSKTRNSNSKKGVHLPFEKIIQLEAIIEEGIQRGLSVGHIVRTNNLNVTERTVYRYIDNDIIRVSQVKMPLKVRRKPRKSQSKEEIFDPRLDFRSFKDYINYISQNNITANFQMDCVEGKRGEEKTFLTLIHEKTGFLIAKVLQTQTQRDVKKALNQIEKQLGAEAFKEIFKVILTDRGPEFRDFVGLENSAITKEKRTQVFYCDPYSPHQKGTIEQSHSTLRRIFPKGKSIQKVTQDELNLAISSINTLTRPKLGGLSPYYVFTKKYGEEIARKLGVEKINLDELTITNRLFLVRK